MPRINIITTYDNKGMARAQRDFAKAQREMSGVGEFAKKAAIGAAGLGIAAGVGALKLATMAEEAQVGDARIANIAKSMGIFGDKSGEVTKRLLDQANAQAALTGVDDDTIKATQAKLLTFKNLAVTADKTGGAFDRAQRAALDMAAAGFGSAENNAVSLGKALEDPIKGITALGRQGVTFTEQEKKKIATLVKSGKTLDAQNMILKAVETQVGGTAAATAKSSDKMKWAFGEAMESVGGLLLPAFENLTTFITTKVLPPIQGFVDKVKSGKDPIGAMSETIKETFGAQASGIFDKIVEVVGKVLDTFKAVGEWVAANRSWLEPLAVGVLVMVAAYKTWAVITGVLALAQAALNIAMTANPIGIIVMAIIGLIAALVYAWKNNEKFRAIVLAVWDNIKGAAIGVWNAVSGAFKRLGAWLVATWTGIKTAAVNLWNGILAFFKKWGAWIMAALLGPVALLALLIIKNWDKIKAGAVTAFTALITWVKGVPGKIKAGLGNLANLLSEAGRRIIQGLWDGMKALWEKAKKWVTGIADWIKENKGPVEKDAKLLQPAGQAIMGGLLDGMKARFGAIKSFISDVNGALAGIGATPIIGGPALAGGSFGAGRTSGGGSSPIQFNGPIQIMLPGEAAADPTLAAASGKAAGSAFVEEVARMMRAM